MSAARLRPVGRVEPAKRLNDRDVADTVNSAVEVDGQQTLHSRQQAGPKVSSGMVCLRLASLTRLATRTARYR